MLTTIDFWHQEKDVVSSYKQSMLCDCVDDSSVLKVTFDAHTHRDTWTSISHVHTHGTGAVTDELKEGKGVKRD